MDWSEPKDLGRTEEGPDGIWPGHSWDLPAQWLPVHYYEALNCLFRIENALRLLVFIGLKKEFGSNWTTINLSTDDEQKVTLASIARRRAANDSKLGYLSPPLPCPLMYLTAGELVGVLLSESYWKIFKGYFPGGSSLMEAKLLEIAHIRNALAHFRNITPEHVTILKQNGTQILKKFEIEFEKLINPFSRWLGTLPPAKVLAKWSLKLEFRSQMAPLICSCVVCKSSSGRWLFVRLTIPAVGVKFQSDETRTSIQGHFVTLDKFFGVFPSIRGACIFATESSLSPTWDGDSPLPPLGNVFLFRFGIRKAIKEGQEINWAELLPEVLLPITAVDPVNLLDLTFKETLSAVECKSKHGTFWRIQRPSQEKAQPSEFPENWKCADDDSSFLADWLSATPQYPWIDGYVSRPD